MDDGHTAHIPPALAAIEADTIALGFDMPSEQKTGVLLRALAASYPNSDLLELGTGTGLATAWLLDGMDAGSSLISVDNDKAASGVALRQLGHDGRLRLIVEDGNEWLANNSNCSFSLIFADAMPGKYENFDLAWNMLTEGGTYIVDDMSPQENWPDGHAAKVAKFLAELDERDDCQLVKMGWSSGIVLAVRSN